MLLLQSPIFAFFPFHFLTVSTALEIRLNLPLKYIFSLLAFLDWLKLQVPVLHGFLKPCKCGWSLFCSGFSFSGETYPWGCFSSFWSKNSVFLSLRCISLSRCIQVPLTDPPLWAIVSLPSDLTERFHNLHLAEGFVNQKCKINTLLSAWKSTVL